MKNDDTLISWLALVAIVGIAVVTFIATQVFK
jgi:hypothetical protein